MTEEKKDLVQKKTKELLSLLQVKAEVNVTEVESQFVVDIKGEDLGILIGYHGERLHNFQLILALIMYHATGAWQNVSVDIDGWSKKRREYLEQLAQKMIQKARTEKRPVTLPYLTGSERRIVHLRVNQEEDVVSESVGEGDQRRLIAKIREKSD